MKGYSVNRSSIRLDVEAGGETLTQALENALRETRHAFPEAETSTIQSFEVERGYRHWGMTFESKPEPWITVVAEVKVKLREEWRDA